MSLSNLRKDAKIKKGSDTNPAVDASGSEYFRLINNATHPITKDIKREIENLKTIGKVLPTSSPLLLSGKVVSKETAEKNKI